MIILLGALYLGYELTETRRENQALVQQLLQARQQGGSDKVKNPTSRGLSKTLLSSNAESIQECFLSMIERSPDTPESGKVLIDWQINSEGKVFEAGVVRDEFSNKEFQKCLGANISRIVFPMPPSKNPVYVEHTFLFRK